MLRKDRFWNIFVPCFILGGALFGWIGFMAAWGAGMRSFGAPSGGGMSARTLGVRAEYVAAFVGVLCAAGVAFCVAAVATREDD